MKVVIVQVPGREYKLSGKGPYVIEPHGTHGARILLGADIIAMFPVIEAAIQAPDEPDPEGMQP